MMKIKVSIWGEPIAKGRPRFTVQGYAYTPARTRTYENWVKSCYEDQAGSSEMLQGELSAEVEAFFMIPKNTSKKKKALMVRGDIAPAKRPDCDNLAKTVLDALNGIAYVDDKQIVNLTVKKRYTDDRPRVDVTLSERTIE